MKFTRLSFDVLDAYVTMVRAAAAEGDYKAAITAGERGLAARLALAGMNPTFTTRVIGVAAETDKSGPAWWPGEVQQYRELLAVTDGSKGKLLVKTPLEWAFRWTTTSEPACANASMATWFPCDAPLIRNQLRRAPQASAARACARWNGVGSGPTSIPSTREGMSSASARSPTASASPGSAAAPPLWPGTWKRPGARSA